MSENEELSSFFVQERQQFLSYIKRIQANCIAITGQ